MTVTTFPSPELSHRRADMFVHAVGLAFIVVAGGFLARRALQGFDGALIAAVAVYIFCALASCLASCAYHFAGWHDRRRLLRRIDHAAIYLSISGTFTPFFVIASTTWTLSLLAVCWGLTVIAVMNKIKSATVKSKWSTASYMGLGAIGLLALPDLSGVPASTSWCVVAGAASYVLGTLFYARKSMPFRYSIWHSWVNLGASFMYAAIWMALP